MSTELNQEKDRLRKHHLQLRRALSAKERRLKDAVIVHKLTRFLSNVLIPSQLLRLGAYIPFEDEVNVLPDLLRQFESSGLNFELSVSMFKPKKPMCFVTPSSTDTFKQFLQLSQGQSAWIIPTPGLWKNADPSRIPYWLIPGICFSRDCKRIGFGLGAYDQWLSRQSGIFIGLAYEVQMTDNISPEPFDIPMDIVFTERHTYVRPEPNSLTSEILGGLK